MLAILYQRTVVIASEYCVHLSTVQCRRYRCDRKSTLQYTALLFFLQRIYLFIIRSDLTIKCYRNKFNMNKPIKYYLFCKILYLSFRYFRYCTRDLALLRYTILFLSSDLSWRWVANRMASKTVSSRNPYPFPKVQNDTDFYGSRYTEVKLSNHLGI